MLVTKLEEVLELAYKKKGAEFVYSTCAELLKIKDKSNKKPIVNGEVCETLLLFLTKTYIKERGIKGNYVRGLVLKDPQHPDSDYRTEIDFVFYTPQIIFCFECKSYAGHKVITDKGLLDNGRYQCDIYSQNSTHAKILHRNIYKFKGIKYQSQNKYHIAMGAFFFSQGDIEDLRDTKSKTVLPIITQETLYNFYDTILRSNATPVWDYAKVNLFLQTLANNTALREEHKRYLQY